MANKITFTADGNSTKASFDYENLPDIESPAKRTNVGDVNSVNGQIGNVELDAADIPYDSSKNVKQKIDDLNLAIENLPKGVVLRGEVDYYNDLPQSPEYGDAYTVKYQGSSGTVADGREFAWATSNTWIEIGVSYTAGANVSIVGNQISATDTTYESKSAAQGGTAVSLVTTGEKYTWNNKSVVVANPTLAGTEADLTGLEVNGVKYKAGGGGGDTQLYLHHVHATIGGGEANMSFTFILPQPDPVTDIGDYTAALVSCCGHVGVSEDTVFNCFFDERGDLYLYTNSGLIVLDNASDYSVDNDLVVQII